MAAPMEPAAQSKRPKNSGHSRSHTPIGVQMQNDGLNRRSFLKTMSSAGMLAALPEAAFGAGHVIHEVTEPRQETDAKPKYSIKFSVCGLSHDHIHGMIGAVQRGGGTLVARRGREDDT